jgi:hypothetical protein
MRSDGADCDPHERIARFVTAHGWEFGCAIGLDGAVPNVGVRCRDRAVRQRGHPTANACAGPSQPRGPNVRPRRLSAADALRPTRRNSVSDQARRRPDDLVAPTSACRRPSQSHSGRRHQQEPVRSGCERLHPRRHKDRDPRRRRVEGRGSVDQLQVDDAVPMEDPHLLRKGGPELSPHRVAVRGDRTSSTVRLIAVTALPCDSVSRWASVRECHPNAD